MERVGSMRRRELLQLIGAGWLADQLLADKHAIEGTIVGANHRLGHVLMSDRAAESGLVAEQADVVIVGSGVAGASAAWRLRATGLQVLMLELEDFAGGTSAWGHVGSRAHPWGAHYLPVPERGVAATRRLLEELGVITGWDAAGRPLFRDDMLCHAPEERLFFQGSWHPGLVPLLAIDGHARAEIDRFRDLQQQLQRAVGRDGRPAFAIPLEHCSHDPKFLALDELSMDAWLRRERFNSAFLRWYVRYATLDDFGAELEAVSAWAALHYFCARKLQTEQLGSGSRYLVWPEGNGWLLRHMLAKLVGQRRHGALVLTVQQLAKGGVELHYLDSASRRTRRVLARGCILATPASIATHLLKGNLSRRGDNELPKRVSSPWVVANLHLRRPIEPSRAWDSVIYDSNCLGYVDAGHQRTQLDEQQIWTYFRPFGNLDARRARGALLHRSWAQLAGLAITELSEPHPELATQLRRIDVMIWAHGMPRPTPGFIDTQRPFATRAMLDRHVAWAHVDQSGVALFEEANLSGVRAAEQLADALGARRGTSWL